MLDLVKYVIGLHSMGPATVTKCFLAMLLAIGSRMPASVVGVESHPSEDISGRDLNNVKVSLQAECADLPGNWIQFGLYCYLVSGHNDNIKWSQGRNRCKGTAEGADLTSIANNAENDFLITQTSLLEEYWIGGYETPNGNFRWSDGTRWKFRKWAPREPCLVCHRKRCINFGHSGWALDRDDTALRYICKLHVTSIKTSTSTSTITLSTLNRTEITSQTTPIRTSTTVEAPSTTLPPRSPYPTTATLTIPTTAPYTGKPLEVCPSGNGWYISTYHCYYLEVNETLGWDEARDKCESLADGRSTLASVADTREFLYLQDTAKRVGGFWLGAVDDGKGYHWIDGTPWDANLTKMAWEPGFIPKPMDCLWYGRTGRWFTKGCILFKNYLCKYKRDILTTALSTTAPTTPTTRTTKTSSTTTTSSTRTTLTSLTSVTTSALPSKSTPLISTSTLSSTSSSTAAHITRPSTASRYSQSPLQSVGTQLVTGVPVTKPTGGGSKETGGLYIIIAIVAVVGFTLVIVIFIVRNRRKKRDMERRDAAFENSGGTIGARENPMYFALDGKDEALLRAKEIEQQIPVPSSPC